MRIASLVPSATEMLFALGLGENVVAVTHECDYPAEAARTPPADPHAWSPEGLDAAGIDAEVKRIVGEGRALYELDEELLDEVAPDLIVTQAVCEVCAVSYDDVVAVAARLPSRAAGAAAGPGDARRDARRRRPARRGRRGRRRAPRSCGPSSKAGWPPSRRPSPAPRGRGCWPSNGSIRPFVGGHWVPEMIEAAGGEDVAARGRREVARGDVGAATSARTGRGRRDAVRLLRRGRARAGDRAPRGDRIPRRAARLRRRRRLVVLAARPAPGRRRRAARPPAAPGPPRGARGPSASPTCSLVDVR